MKKKKENVCGMTKQREKNGNKENEYKDMITIVTTTIIIIIIIIIVRVIIVIIIIIN